MLDNRTASTSHLEKVLPYLAHALQQLTDKQLDELHHHLFEGRPESFPPIESPFAEVPREAIAMARTINCMSDLIDAEKNHRRAVIYNAETEMMGGHRVTVGWCIDARYTWQAICDPVWDDETRRCWVGPPRDTKEAAIEDGRAHHQGYEPEVFDDDRAEH